MSKPSIGFMAGNIDACALWRLWFPYMNMPNCGFYYVFQGQRVLTHDAIVVQRLGFQQNLQAMQGMRRGGLKVIYDLDDYLWNIPDWNPHAELLRKVAHGYTTCLLHADIITVSTKPLKKSILKKHGKQLINIETQREIPVIVCENHIDLRFVAPRQEKEEIIVGWAGSDTHSADFEVALPGLKQCIEEFPNVVFEFAGWIPEELSKYPNVRFRYWSPVSEFMSRYPRWGWTIALAPLCTHEFNGAKSGNKMTEAGAMGIPCLASWEPPYSDFCRHNPKLEWLLCAGKDRWYEKLKTLLTDPVLRDEYGAMMRENVEQQYSWNREHEGWNEVLELVQCMP